MNRHVNANADRLSLRPPPRRSLEIPDRITEIARPAKDTDAEAS
jgi:type III restriction enzyme